MYWVEVTADFLHQFNRNCGNGVYRRDLMEFKKGDRYYAFGKGGKVFTDPISREIVTREFYIIKPHGYGEQHVRPDKFKEIQCTAEENALGKVLYGE